MFTLRKVHVHWINVFGFCAMKYLCQMQWINVNDVYNRKYFCQSGSLSLMFTIRKGYVAKKRAGVCFPSGPFDAYS